MVWLQVSSNALIGSAYVSISATLYFIVRRIRDIPFQWMYLAFGLFIITCGMTHFMDVVTIWWPYYWIDGSIRALTAFASLGTAIMLVPLVPKAISLAAAARVAHERGIQLEAANRDLGRLYERSKELERLKTEVFANVSHELRTPLMLVLGPAERLARDARLDEAQRRDLEVIGRNARALLKHVNDLLDVTKLESGEMAPRYAELDLAELLRRTCANFEVEAADRSLRYTVEAPRVLPAQLDPDKIQRVIMNLLSNAFKFTSPGGRVRCTLVEDRRDGARWARLEIADSGPGIPPAARQAVFERFRQLDHGAAREHGGTGLGLAITKEFIELHHGRVVAVGAPEGGALLVVELPLSAPEGAKVAPRAPEADLHLQVAAQVALEELRSRVDVIAPKNERGQPAFFWPRTTRT
jgi:signal transduction histidine kinase